MNNSFRPEAANPDRWKARLGDIELQVRQKQITMKKKLNSYAGLFFISEMPNWVQHDILPHPSLSDEAEGTFAKFCGTFVQHRGLEGMVHGCGQNFCAPSLQ